MSGRRQLSKTPVPYRHERGCVEKNDIHQGRDRDREYEKRKRRRRRRTKRR